MVAYDGGDQFVQNFLLYLIEKEAIDFYATKK